MKKSLENSKIAIIGGGIGGLAAAYYLSKSQSINHNNAANIMITLIEQGDTLGGRIKQYDLGKEVDFGGKYLLDSNNFAIDLCNNLGLTLIKSSDERIIINKENKILVPNSHSSIGTKITAYSDLVLKYRLSLIKLLRKSKVLSTKLDRFYEILYTSNNISDDLNKEFSEFFTQDSRSYLIAQGLSEKLVDDFFNPFQRGIYMQNLDELVSLFVILLLGAFDKDLLVVQPNNSALISALEREITDRITVNLSEVVKEIQKIDVNGAVRYTITTETRTLEDVSEIFIATTYKTAAKISYVGFEDRFYDYLELIKQIKYSSNTFKYFVQGIPNSEIFDDLRKGRYHHINDGSNVYTIENISVTNEIASNSDQDIYLVTSTNEDATIDEYFTEFHILDRRQWRNAYPNYTVENWKNIDAVKKYELKYPELFSSITVSTNNYITTIETSIKSGLEFSKKISKAYKYII